MGDFGKVLHETTVKRGLKELNSDLHFDMGAKLGLDHPFMDIRQGVFYKGKHLGSMDRGEIPEFKVWTVSERAVPCSLGEADDEDVSIRYVRIAPNHPGYSDLYNDTRLGRTDEYTIQPNGWLVRLSAHRRQKVKDRVYQVGWRHTFERILRAKVPGISRRSLGAKFGVDLFLVPLGDQQEVVDALVRE